MQSVRAKHSNFFISFLLLLVCKLNLSLSSYEGFAQDFYRVLSFGSQGMDDLSGLLVGILLSFHPTGFDPIWYYSVRTTSRFVFLLLVEKQKASA